MSYIKNPEDIEKRSFEIIESELGEKVKRFTTEELPIIKRVIHTTADFEYADLIEFSKEAIKNGKESLINGCRLYCDTNMIVNGLSKNILKKFECEPYSLVADEKVSRLAKERGVTRSIVGIEEGSKDEKTKIYLIGNAPTALYRLKELIDEKKIEMPKLVIAVPVGFVGAEESKEILRGTDIPYIIVRGRKGGSPVAVSILHGILYQLYKRDGF